MDLIVMLTRDDMTVPDCLEVLDRILPLGIGHIGFKDVGVPIDVQRTLRERIRAAGAMAYFEVVSETPEACRRSTEVAAELGVDRLLGGTDLVAMSRIVAGTDIELYPFCGFPVGHPTRLGGSAADVARHCRELVGRGAAGVDLLAYRATDADPEELVAAARGALGPGRLIVAGSIDGPDRLRRMARLGVDGITVGTAFFEEAFAPGAGDVVGQIQAALTLMATV